MATADNLPPRAPAPYDLKAPVSGMGLRDPRSALLFWGVGSVLLGLMTTVLLVRGEIRWLVLILLGFLGLASLVPRRGVFILTAFLPFMYFLRRSVLTFQEFSSRDPILLFPVITSIGMFLGVIIFFGPQVMYYVRRSLLVKMGTILLVVFFFQMFNPVQGSLLVGLAGGIYFIYPLLWLFFGLLIDREGVERLLKLVFVIGVITTIYGLYQHYFGMTEFEIYELKAKGFYKAMGGEENARVMSTFSSLVDFSRYMTITGFLAFAYFWREKRAMAMLAILGMHLWALLYTASRTSYLVLFFSVTMLVIVSGKNVRKIAMRGVVTVLAVVVLYSVLYKHDPQRVYRQSFSSNAYVVHTMSGLTHPTEEGSFQARLRMWRYITVSTLVGWPPLIGHGLGTTTTAAGKFEGGQYLEADSYLFEITWGSGLAAPILLVLMGLSVMRGLLWLRSTWQQDYLYMILFAIMCGVFLSSLFGVTLRDSISGPLCWLLIGWVAREQVDRRQAAQESDLAEAA